MSQKLIRFGVSMEKDLLARFDNLARRRGEKNRSEALRNLVRETLIEDAWQDKRQTLYGTITLVYHHHARGLNTRLLDIQHDFADTIVTTVHVHAEHDTCMEVLVVRDKPRVIGKLRDALGAIRGVDLARVSLAAPEKETT